MAQTSLRLHLLFITSVLCTAFTLTGYGDNHDKGDLPPDIEHGREIFNSTCIICHGSDGKGAFPGVPNLKDKDSRLAKKEINTLLTNIEKGIKSRGSIMAMPPKGGNPSLTRQDIVDVLGYMQMEIAGIQTQVRLGVLKCEVVPGSRKTILNRSSAEVTCTFDNQGTIEHYKGETDIVLGLDLTIKKDEKMAFTVLAASPVAASARGAYALAGRYVGDQVDAAVSMGLSVKVLVGDSDKNISLQPLALDASTVLGISVGPGFFSIEPAE